MGEILGKQQVIESSDLEINILLYQFIIKVEETINLKERRKINYNLEA